MQCVIQDQLLDSISKQYYTDGISPVIMVSWIPGDIRF